MADHYRSEGTPSLPTVFAGVLSLLAVLMAGYFFSSPSPDRVNVEEMRGTYRAKVLAELRKEEDSKLSNLAWVKKEEGIARVPIQTAMQITVKELENKPKKTSAVKADPPLAVPADGAALPSAPGGARLIQFSRAVQDAQPPAAVPGNSTPN